MRVEQMVGPDWSLTLSVLKFPQDHRQDPYQSVYLKLYVLVDLYWETG
jgi:hypothetical protein